MYFQKNSLNSISFSVMQSTLLVNFPNQDECFFSQIGKDSFWKTRIIGEGRPSAESLSPQAVHKNYHSIQLQEFTESNFIFLLLMVSLERILNQKTLEKKGPQVPNPSLTFQVRGQAGGGGEDSQSVQPSQDPGLLDPSPGLSPPGGPKNQMCCTPEAVSDSREVANAAGLFSHICFSDGDREERWVKISPGTSIFQQLPCLIPNQPMKTQLKAYT